MASLSYKTLTKFISDDEISGLISFLRNDHVNVDDQDEKGRTALMFAAEHGKYECVKKLVENHSNVNVEDNNNYTALLLAAKEGHSKIVSFLLQNNADLEHRDMNGWPPLLWACYKGHVSTVRLFLQASADPNVHEQYDLSCLAWAAGRNRPEIVKDLLSYGAKVNLSDKYGTTPLVWACRKGAISIVEDLLNAGASVDAAGMYSWTPLLVATLGNFTDIVMMLLDHKPNVNCTDKDGFTPLIIACKNGNNLIVNALLNCGAYVNICDRNGDTSLIHAVKGGHSEVISSLVQKYADVNIQGSDKKTALYWAVEKSNVSVAKLILSANPEIDCANVNGDTPLMRATRNRLKELVQMLLEKNAKVQATDKRGDTALHIAMRSQSKGIVELLLRNPKNSRLLYKSNKNGETPYSLDSVHQKSILATIFGARRLNTNEDSENLLGYDLYSSCLADILSEPTLSMPISVGLYAKWGSGKSFLLNKLQDEMKMFSAQVINPAFNFSWELILLNSQISSIFGIVLGMIFNSIIVGLISGSILFVLLCTFLAIIWYGFNNYDWDWCFHSGIFIATRLKNLKLLFEILFCHPPNQHQDWQMQSIKFLFTSQTKASCSGSQMTVNQIIESLYEAVEMEWGKLVPRLYSVFKPSVVSSDKKMYRSTCFIPTVVIVFVLYILSLSSFSVMSYYRNYFKGENNVKLNDTVITVEDESWDIPSPFIFLILMATVFVLLFLINFFTVLNIFSSLIFPFHQKFRHFKSGTEFDEKKSDGYFQEIRKEVIQISNLVKCIEGFTGRLTRIVIVVDGLDSCEQDKVLKMLDTVRLLFSDQNSPYVTLLAIDPHIIIKAIESNITRILNDNTINGRDYMNNIIHLPFYLQNSALRGVEIARRTSQICHKASIISNEETVKDLRRDSVLSNISVNDSFRSKIAQRQKINDKRTSVGPSSFAKRVRGAQDLTKVLLSDDYFSDVNPRSMRRLMNVVYVTGRLMKAFNIEFNWYHMASWINITEQWPYRTSWIIYYYDMNEKNLDDDVSLKHIYEKVCDFIPSSKEIDPMIEIDRNGRKFEIFLKYHTSSLKVAELKVFRPFTINLDPYLLKLIKENMKNVEQGRKFDKTSLSRVSSLANHPHYVPNSAKSQVLNQGLEWGVQNPYFLFDPNKSHDMQNYFSSMHQDSAINLKDYSKRLNIPDDVKLTEMCTEDLCKLLDNIDGIDQMQLDVYKEVLVKHNISGLVLMSCEMNELKSYLKMAFGDWELFRQMILILKLREYNSDFHNESADSLSELKDENFRFSHRLNKRSNLKPRRGSVSDVKKLSNKRRQSTHEIRSLKQSGDQLTKQVTLEETMIFGALQNLNEEAKEQALEVQMLQDDSTTSTAEKHPGYSTKNSKHSENPTSNGIKETEVLYLSSPPSSPKFGDKSISVSLSPKLKGEGSNMEMASSRTVANLQNIYRDYCPSLSKAIYPSEQAAPCHQSSVHFSDETKPDLKPYKLTLSASSSLERLHVIKNKIINAISPISSNTNALLFDKKESKKSISPLALPAKDAELGSDSSLCESTSLVLSSSNSEEDMSENSSNSLINLSTNNEQLYSLTKPPLLRQCNVESDSSSQNRFSQDSTSSEVAEDFKRTSVGTVANAFQLLSDQIFGGKHGDKADDLGDSVV